MIHAVLYTKPKCVQCKMTRRKMPALNFPYVDNYYGDCHEDNSIDVEKFVYLLSLSIRLFQHA